MRVFGTEEVVEKTKTEKSRQLRQNETVNRAYLVSLVYYYQRFLLICGICVRALL